jgi:hypothetical protein
MIDAVEIFADSVTDLIFDAQTLELELSVSHLYAPKASASITGRRYKWVCRRRPPR